MYLVILHNSFTFFAMSCAVVIITYEIANEINIVPSYLCNKRQSHKEADDGHGGCDAPLVFSELLAIPLQLIGQAGTNRLKLAELVGRANMKTKYFYICFTFSWLYLKLSGSQPRYLLQLQVNTQSIQCALYKVFLLWGVKTVNFHMRTAISFYSKSEGRIVYDFSYDLPTRLDNYYRATF